MRTFHVGRDINADMRSSLRTKLVLFIAAQNVLVSLFLFLYFPDRMEGLSRGWVEDQATTLATVVSSSVAQGVEYDDPVYTESILRALATAPAVRYATVRRSDGTVLAALHGDRYQDVGLRAGEGPTTKERGGELHVVAPIQAESHTGVLAMGFSLEQLRAEKKQNFIVVGSISLLILGIGLLVSVGVGTYVVAPVRRITGLALKVGMGDLSERPTGVRGHDKVAQMARAFSEMIESQRAMVREIGETASQLASAGTEIYAAAHEQEAAATEQQVAVEEVARTMQSLLEAAGHIAESAQGVLDNAEQTLETTDDAAGRIAELSAHTNRIAELLEVIRDIADRSDLLALNAGLEATRAGDSGRAFSLLAAEMRRLAERVTASVQDVKSLVADVRASGSSTVVATEKSRSLAENTTESARQISTVTQQQRTGTEQVSESMKQFSEVLSQSVSTTQETRTAAEELKSLADRLAELVGRYRLE
jgi:methyl-accepting chemotaxis protein